MKDKKLSETLREIRHALRLTQPEMAQTISMGEKMYQLYESGRYDDTGSDSVKRQKLLDKIEIVKNKILIGRGAGTTKEFTDMRIIELQKESEQLKQKVMELQAELITAYKQLNLKTKKIIASGTSSQRNKN